MAIDLPCPQCGTLLRMGDETAGRQAKCPHCGRIFTIPLPAMALSTAPVTPAYRPIPGATPQAFLHRPLASLLARFFGAMLDGLIGGMAMAPGFILLIITGEPVREGNHDLTPGQILSGMILFMGLVAIACLQMYLIATSGQSLGKKIVGTRIVNKTDGLNPGFVKAVILRSWVPVMIGNVPCIGAIFTITDYLFIFGEERQCLHDKIADTLVVEA